MGTPVVVTHNHYGFCDDVDSVVTVPKEIVNRVKALYENEAESERVGAGGHKRYLEHHTAEAVGSRFFEICTVATRLLS
jgi:hypothetical protein